MDNKIKVLINVPRVNQTKGGVIDYFDSLSVYFSNDIKYNYVGSKSASRYFVFLQLWDYIRYILIIIWYQPKLIHLNPSLDKKSIFRDAVFLILAKMLFRKVLIFWRGWHENTEEKVKPYLFRIIFNIADGFVVLAKSFKDKLLKWKISKPIYLETTKVDDKLLEGFNIQKKDYNKVTFLFLSSIFKTKGIYEAIKTFELIQNRHVDVELFIAGDGPEIDEIIKFTKYRKIKNVFFLGYVKGKQKKDVYLNSNIFLFPTYGEGMPNSVLEAMAFGLVIITRPVGGLKDFFKNNKMGFITESKEPIVYAEYINNLMEDQEKIKKIGLYNHQYAKKHFLASIVAKRLRIIYEKMLSD